MEKMENETYKTSDITLAAVLSMSAPPVTLDRLRPGKVAFVFKRTGALEKCVGKFWDRKVRVEPLRFAEHRRVLKTRIFADV